MEENKKKSGALLWIIIIIILVIAGYFLFTKKYDTKTQQTNTNQQATTTEMLTASYTDGTSTVNASFDTTNNTVTFNQADIGTTTLPIAVSGSGARYANADESVVFWEHQGEVTITKDGVDVFKGQKIENQ